MSVQLLTVTDDEADIRLDRWLKRKLPGLTQSVAQKLCRTGQVRVDGRRCETATRLLPGQSVRVPPVKPQVGLPPVAARVDAPVDRDVARDLEALVLYRDDAVIMLNKPFGLPVQGGPGITRHLDAYLDALKFGAGRPKLVHRLDRDTSGVLALARTPGAAAKLALAFRSRRAEKLYWAVVAGRPVPAEGEIDQPLRRIEGDMGRRTEAAARDDADAARAITEYRTLDTAARRLAWLELRPLTGRTHQLRVHCVGLGTPILGDRKYHEPDQNDAFSAIVDGLPRGLHLHARRLALPHPDGGTVFAEAPLPDHMAETFRILGFAAPKPNPAGRH